MPQSRRKQLGQYFTPLPVVDFILDAMHWLSNENISGAESRLVIDPACGDAAFLRRAIERRLAAPERVYGLEKDDELVTQWSDTDGGSAAMPANLQVGDGLLCDRIGDRSDLEGTFHWVVGNPPYSGQGLRGADRETLLRIAERYELCGPQFADCKSKPEKLRRMPPEVLFVERFYRLCRPGGIIGIILPVGIFANQRWRFVRQWLLPEITLHIVVTLPRTTFRSGGITASTCVAVMRRQPADHDHQVLMARVDSVSASEGSDDLSRLLKMWKDGRTTVGTTRPWDIDSG